MLHVHMVSGVMWLLATHSVLMNSTVLMLKWDHLTSRLQELHKWRCIANLCWSQFQPLPLMRLVFILVSRFVIGQIGGSAGCVTAIMKQKHAQPLWWFSEGLWGITILLQWIFLNKTIYFLSNSVFFYCYVILHVLFHGWPMCNIFFVRFCVCVCVDTGWGTGLSRTGQRKVCMTRFLLQVAGRWQPGVFSVSYLHNLWWPWWFVTLLLFSSQRLWGSVLLSRQIFPTP